jgi:hypothetical protein
MPDIAFNSNFSYSSSGVYHYDVDPISLTVHQDCSDLQINGLDIVNNPSNQLVTDTFDSFKYARKQTQALFVASFDSTETPNFGEGNISGFYNLTAFTPESGSKVGLAFNTYLNSFVNSYCIDFNFGAFTKSGGNSMITTDVNRIISTANNCLFFPDLSQAIGVPIIFSQANQIGQYDETKIIKYPKKDQSSYTQTTSNRYPDILPALGINEHHHISMVSSFDAYYYTIGSGGGNALRVAKIPYRSESISASQSNTSPINISTFILRLASSFASSTMWVDGFNDLFISHGDKVCRISTQLPARNIWLDSAFLPTNFTEYSIVNPLPNNWIYVIERALVNYKTGKHYALCSRVPIGNPQVINPTTQYLCELIIDVTNSVVLINELNGIPIPISPTANKHINIPTYSNYLVYTCVDSTITCCDLNDFTLHPITKFMEFTDNFLGAVSTNIEVISITQPTFNSSSNYLTVKQNNNFSVWKLKPLAKNY